MLRNVSNLLVYAQEELGQHDAGLDGGVRDVDEGLGAVVVQRRVQQKVLGSMEQTAVAIGDTPCACESPQPVLVENTNVKTTFCTDHLCENRFRANHFENSKCFSKNNVQVGKLLALEFAEAGASAGHHSAEEARRVVC